MIFTVPAALGAVKSVLMNKYVLIGILLIGMFLSGYIYRGNIEKGRQAREVVKEVIRYVESTSKIDTRYNDIDTHTNIEHILCGQVSSHSGPCVP